MIIADRKPLPEIIQAITATVTANPAPADQPLRILILGCGGCTTICHAGGEKETRALAALLRLHFGSERDDRGQGMTEIEIEIEIGMIERQCEWEWVDTPATAAVVDDANVVVSLACGIGVQAMAECYPDTPILPGLNTAFMGMPDAPGVWRERCAACGDCQLARTAGICPVARCAKQLMNGPCGGAEDGRCEVDPDLPCAWQLIYDRLDRLGQLDRLDPIEPPRDWRPAGAGGPRSIVREELICDR